MNKLKTSSISSSSSSSSGKILKEYYSKNAGSYTLLISKEIDGDMKKPYYSFMILFAGSTIEREIKATSLEELFWKLSVNKK